MRRNIIKTAGAVKHPDSHLRPGVLFVLKEARKSMEGEKHVDVGRWVQIAGVNCRCGAPVLIAGMYC